MFLLFVTMFLKMCLTVTLRKKQFIDDKKIQKKKGRKYHPKPHQHAEQCMVRHSINCLKMHFPSFYFQHFFFLQRAPESPVVSAYTLKINHSIPLVRTPVVRSIQIGFHKLVT